MLSITFQRTDELWSCITIVGSFSLLWLNIITYCSILTCTLESQTIGLCPFFLCIGNDWSLQLQWKGLYRAWEAEEWLCHCLVHCLAQWMMFKGLAPDRNNHTTVVANLLRKWVDECVPVKTIWVFHNEKPWIGREISKLLRPRPVAFTSGNSDQ